VVAAFTTVEAALTDLPALLSYRRSTNLGESQSSLLERALDFDSGTLLISPDVLGLELTPDESIIQAVVIGAAFLPKLREIEQACSEAGGHTTWLIVDVEKSKRLSLGQEAKAENLGSRLKQELEIWIKNGASRRKENRVRVF
jgi:hypothetical protein